MPPLFRDDHQVLLEEPASHQREGEFPHEVLSQEAVDDSPGGRRFAWRCSRRAASAPRIQAASKALWASLASSASKSVAAAAAAPCR